MNSTSICQLDVNPGDTGVITGETLSGVVADV